jgi:glycosyltransferase involved in cell wall biosynthesis
MKIGIVCPSYPPNDQPDGIGDYTQILANTLASRDNDVSVWTRRSYPTDEGEGLVRIIPFCDRWSFRALRLAADLASREKLDVLDIQYAPDMYPAGGAFLVLLPLWMRFSGCKTVTAVSFHTLGGRSWRSRAKSFFLIQGAAGIISTNEEVTYLLNKYVANTLPKTREILIGSNIRPGMESREVVRPRVLARLGIPEGVPILAHFGQYYPGKGVETLLEAAALLLQSGTCFKLLMLGGSKADSQGYEQGLRGKARFLGLGESILWTGPRPAREVAEFLAASDLYVVPFDGGVSTRRGSLMAGLACGMAVVTTYPHISSHYFRDGENVALAPPKEKVELARVIRELLDNDERRLRLQRGALELSREFSWDRIAEQTEDFFCELVAAREK